MPGVARSVLERGWESWSGLGVAGVDVGGMVLWDVGCVRSGPGCVGWHVGVMDGSGCSGWASHGLWDSWVLGRWGGCSGQASPWLKDSWVLGRSGEGRSNKAEATGCVPFSVDLFLWHGAEGGL